MKQDIYVYLENLLSEFIEFAPQLLTALSVLLLGYVLGRVIEGAVRRLILYLNSSVNRGLPGTTLNIDLRSTATFTSIAFFWIAITVSLLISLRILGLTLSGGWFDRIVEYVPNLIAAVIIVLVGIALSRLLAKLIRKGALRTGSSSGKYLSTVVKYLILFVTLVVAIDQIGIDIVFLEDLFVVLLASLLFGASFSFGLGAKTSVSNILGSYYFRKTHRLGTRIRLEDIEGTIVKISDHAISLETKEGLVVVPAKRFSEHNVTIVKDENT
ncbi:mechanosensitive ion channel family protein [Tunicatimonas pelagia]|uniref:mechanosensitive ion channel family protein n=1 Tax=Tunicatimonas pelagia TaxID=931531 RepID=UPI00266579B8|nr:mechanosensitive ion channel domain-containing protein [Tunicatimonas pelagia]WKN41266.1 mechanosensitive ion channel [Tunicatimonas pelagia]